MKKTALIFLAFFGLMFLAPQVVSAQLKQERIKASYLLAIGRLPTDAELTWWGQQNDYTVSQLVEAHRTYMNTTNKNSKADPIKQTYNIVFGRDPQPAETEYWKGRNEVCWEMIPQHVNYLNQNKFLYDDVINRAYILMFSKAPDATQLNRWKSEPIRSYAEIIYLLYSNPPAGYSINPSNLFTALKYYSDFSMVSFSAPVVAEVSAITGGADLYSKFKAGIR